MLLQLGFPDKPCDATDSLDKIGGLPYSFDQKPSDLSLECLNCHKSMHLVLQFVTLMDRQIYVFGCTRSQCHLMDKG